MMLHEAVMLEIYRQALNASELVSPRCQSRDSNGAAAAADNRCPSNDSLYSAHDVVSTAAGASTPTKAVTPAPAPSSTSPHMEIPLAAYLNAANHLFMNNTLATSLVHGIPNVTTRRLLSPDTTEDAALDFSAKAEITRDSADEDEEDDEEEEICEGNSEGSSDQAADSSTPLDLSCASRKRPSTEKTVDAENTSSSPKRKVAKINEFKSWVTPSLNPYLAAVAAASISPKPTNSYGNEWKKPATNEASKALERMTEMTKLGAAAEKADPPQKQQTTSSSNGSGRHSAWQSHWLNKGAHSVKDVFKCVWCKQSFPTLATLTTHMKETKHCGVNVPPVGNSSHQSQSMSSGSISSNVTTATNMLNNNNNNNNHNNTNSKKSDLSLLIKETMPLPRKLVRGQDVWLGKGAEQTRQILKCMWCGQSFRSLAEMTSHMQETQHYTNIISQEQIISWKSTDEKISANGSGGAASPTSPSTTASMSNGPNVSNTVSAVLTCKVCDQAFASLKELSNHMVKNAHYKDPIIMRDNSESPSLSGAGGRGRGGRQTREKRKKSLPVRKLLEIERAGQEQYGKGNNVLDPELKPLRDFAASTKISCEKCGDKIETALFVEHIRQCLGGALLATPRNAQQKSRFSPQTPSEGANRKSADDRHFSPLSSNTQSDILSASTKESATKETNSLPSVLNALEQLIEKSFDIRPTRQNSGIYGAGGASNTPLGASILKRLGIDDNVDYTKPLMDPHSMRYRSNSIYSGRDRSASESSSISERCSSLLEAPTPERNLDISRQTTPRLLTPEKLTMTPKEHAEREVADYAAGDIKIKTEPSEEHERREEIREENIEHQTHKISVKKEFNEFPNADGDVNKTGGSVVEDTSKRTPTPQTSSSPSVSERSITPKSNHSNKKMNSSIGSSLTALSSMFDSLNNMTTADLFTTADTNNNNNNNNSNNNNNNCGKSGGGSGKKSNSNPLAALQKLCETTSDAPAANTRSNNATTSTISTGGGGGIVGASTMPYGWDAVDAMTKCAYCDTGFYTKGAYRHHLLKVHFIKDDNGASGTRDKSPKSNFNSPRSTSKSPATSTITSSSSARQELSPPSMLMPNNNMPTINPYEESPQSKFRKYTELAKQLSSKNT